MDIASLPEGIRSELECPICLRIRSRYVVVCNSGHSHCEYCVTQLLCQPSKSRCGFCRENFLPARLQNLVLNGLARQLGIKDEGPPPPSKNTQEKALKTRKKRPRPQIDFVEPDEYLGPDKDEDSSPR